MSTGGKKLPDESERVAVNWQVSLALISCVAGVIAAVAAVVALFL